MAGVLKWHGSEVLLSVEGKTEIVLDRGSDMIVNEIRALMRQPKTGVHYPGKVTRSSAKGEAPAVQDNKLRGSLHWFRPKSLTRLIGTNLEYSFFLEVGTSKMAARPFLRPAFRRTVPKIAKLLRRLI